MFCLVGGGNDILIGRDGNDTLQGGDGNDTVEGGAGNDNLGGGQGNDQYLFDADVALGTDTITEEVTNGVDTIDFSQTSTLGARIDLTKTTLQVVNTNLRIRLSGGMEIERIIGTSRNDTLIGNNLDNVLIGGGGVDTLDGMGGRDLLVGGAGVDNLRGGTGEDILISDSFAYFNESTGVLNVVAIDQIMLEWTRTNLSYSNRISNLRLGTGLNGTTKLDASSVVADLSSDTLQGDLDLDWFWKFGSDTISDLNNGGPETVS
ncbi:MAG: hypothetical protein U0930_24795 [Pirellulales bacterium]